MVKIESKRIVEDQSNGRYNVDVERINSSWDMPWKHTMFYEKHAWLIFNDKNDLERASNNKSHNELLSNLRCFHATGSYYKRTRLYDATFVGDYSGLLNICPICNSVVTKEKICKPLCKTMFVCSGTDSKNSHKEVWFKTTFSEYMEFVKGLHLFSLNYYYDTRKLELEIFTDSHRPLFNKNINPASDKDKTWVITKEPKDSQVESRWKEFLMHPEHMLNEPVKKTQQQLLIEKLDKERISSILPDRKFHDEFMAWRNECHE